jgi:hypothetical protein
MKFTDRLKNEGITQNIDSVSSAKQSFTDRLKARTEPTTQISPGASSMIGPAKMREQEMEYEQTKWQEGVDDPTKRDSEWKRINTERAKARMQAEEDRKPTVQKFLGNLGSQMKKTIFGGDAQREIQQQYGTDMSTGSKVLDTAANIGGTILGYTMPIPGAQGGSLFSATNSLAKPFTQRIAANVGNKAVGRIAEGVAEGAITGAPIGLYEGFTQNLTPEETAKRVAQETLLGGAAGGVLAGLGEGISALRKGSKTAQKAVENADNTITPTTEIRQPNANIEQPAPAIQQQTTLEKLSGVNRTADDIQKEIQQLETRKADLVKRLLNRKASQPKNDVQRIQNNSMIEDLQSQIDEIDNRIKVNLQRFAEKPQPVTSQGMKQSKFAQTIAQSDQVALELKSSIEDKNIMRDVKPSEQTLDRARQLIETNYDEAVRLAKDPTANSAESSAVSQLLIQKFQQEGRWQDALDIVEKTTLRATEQGQAIQALSMWGRLTPEGMLKYAQRVVDKANEGIKDAGKKVKLTEEFAEDITESMNKIQTMADGREKEVEIAKVLDKISEQVPPSLWDKISTLQTMAQLLNPKTAIRNLGGNALFAAVENVSKVAGVPIDAIISKVTGTRSVLFPSLETQAKGFKKGFKLGFEDAVKGIDTSGIKTQFDIRPTKVFRSKILGGLETAMNVELKAADRAFYQSTFEDSLREQMKIAKVDVPTEQMIETAHLDGLYRTFQDTNKISQVFTGLKRSLNRGKPFGLGDFIMKYPKTPANILARGIDYSPIGGVKALYDLGKLIVKSDGNQREIVQGLSRGITGSGILFGGLMLAKLGIITGKTDKDAEARDFKKEVGLGGYKLNTSALVRFLGSGMNPEAAKPKQGDTIMNYDWLQPSAISMAAGANIAQKQKFNTLDFFGALVTSLQAGTQSLAEQPLLQGITNLFNGYDSEDKVTGAIKSIGTSAVASFVPTFMNQARQLVDNTSRSTKSDNPIQEAANLVINKVPGLSKVLPENVTTLGETKQIYQNNSNNLLNVLFNPAFITKYDVTPGTQLILDLYENTGDVRQFPRKVKSTITDNKEKIELTKQQTSDLQRVVGSKTKEYIEKLAGSESFNKLNDDKKLEKIIDALNKAGDYGRTQIKKEIKNDTSK